MMYWFCRNDEFVM